MNNKKVLIALSFGSGEDHGISNYYIAKALADNMYVEQCAGIAQWEIYEIIQKNFLDRITHLQLYSIEGKKNKYLDTFDVLKHAALLVVEKGYESISYIGHPAHLWRVRSVAFKLGIPEDIKIVSNIPYDEYSTQWWTRSALRFWAREVPVIIVSYLMGRL